MGLIGNLHNSYWVLLMTTTLLLSCNSLERDCSLYKSGSFITYSTINDSIYTSIFTRNDTIQIENFNGKIDTSACRWINDCEFVLRTLNPKSRLQKKNIHIKILSTTDSTYTYEYSFVGENRKETGLAIKMND
tara:strand:- start:614 stop:1012 length:399 start_codon:yes stop_codon:yes gene_type:complete